MTTVISTATHRELDPDTDCVGVLEQFDADERYRFLRCSGCGVEWSAPDRASRATEEDERW